MRSRVSAILIFALALGACGLVVKDDGSSGPSSGASSKGMADFAPTQAAEELLRKPTQDLVDQAVQDHTLTDEERAVVAVYWAWIIDGLDKGELDESVIESGLLDRVSDLWGKYPSFFERRDARVGASRGALMQGETVSCETSCAPTASLLTPVTDDLKSAVAFWKGAQSPAKPVADVVIDTLDTVPGAVKSLLGAFRDGWTIGKNLDQLVQTLVSEKKADVLTVTNNVAAIGNATFALLVKTGAVVVAAETAQAVAVVGAIWGIWKLSVSAVMLLDLVETCRREKAKLTCWPVDGWYGAYRWIAPAGPTEITYGFGFSLGQLGIGRFGCTAQSTVAGSSITFRADGLCGRDVVGHGIVSADGTRFTGRFDWDAGDGTRSAANFRAEYPPCEGDCGI